MRKKPAMAVNFILIAALTIALVRFGAQEPLTAEATSNIKKVEESIAGLTSQIEGIGQEIENMEEKQEILEEEMADLNAEIINTMTSIGLKEDEIAAKQEEIRCKQADIDAAEEEYERVKERETEQYGDMVTRLRKMYEGGDVGDVTWILSGDSLRESLNRMDYVEKVYEFDRVMLQEIKETREKVLELWNQMEEDKLALEDEETNLELEKTDLQNARANLDALLEKKQQQSANYDAEIKRARRAASEAKAKLQQEQKKLQQLLEEQKKANAGGSNAAGGTYTSDYNSIINAASGSELGKQVARYACQYIGNPYVYGGTSLTNGADCSGFTYRVYKDFGYSLPRTSYEQQSAGTGVDYSNAQPGDLICYSGHVAIYIGGGKIVHASTEKTGIKVSNAGYRAIVAVRRII